MGEEYLLEEIKDLSGDTLSVTGEVFADDILYWIGYIYRFWHYYTGEYSKKIYLQASAVLMKRNYMMFHTLDPVLAVENLKELHKQGNKK